MQSTAKELRSGFPFFAYHDTVSALWSDKWRGPCARGIYPFTDALVDDFDPIFAQLVETSNDDSGVSFTARPASLGPGKAAYKRGGRLLDPPSMPVDIPFEQVDTSRGDLDAPVPAYLRLPDGARPGSGWPVVLFICGLDAARR